MSWGAGLSPAPNDEISNRADIFVARRGSTQRPSWPRPGPCSPSGDGGVDLGPWRAPCRGESGPRPWSVDEEGPQHRRIVAGGQTLCVAVNEVRPAYVLREPHARVRDRDADRRGPGPCVYSPERARARERDNRHASVAAGGGGVGGLRRHKPPPRHLSVGGDHEGHPLRESVLDVVVVAGVDGALRPPHLGPLMGRAVAKRSRMGVGGAHVGRGRGGGLLARPGTSEGSR